VAEYFPENANFVRRADQQLARLYLQDGDYDRALKLFQKFAQMEDVEKQFRAFGLAGQAIVLAAQGKQKQSADKLVELAPLSSRLDNQMRELIVQMLKKNDRLIGTEALKQWRSLLQPPAGAPPRGPRGRATGGPGPGAN
jgi:lipopolysaccharide biosynthesis regulator YciM